MAVLGPAAEGEATVEEGAFASFTLEVRMQGLAITRMRFWKGMRALERGVGRTESEGAGGRDDAEDADEGHTKFA